MGMMRYVLDARASQFTVQAFAEGLAGIAEHQPTFSIGDFSGEIGFDIAHPDGGSLQLTAKVESLAIKDEVTQQDRQAIERVMFSEVLHPKRFPEVTFRSSKVVCSRVEENRYRADIQGALSLEGMENCEEIHAQLVLGNGSLRAYGELRVRQTDYGLTIASVAGGMLRIKDELKFVFFIVARQHQ